MVSRKIVLRFPKNLVDKPVIYKLVKEYDVIFNILKAEVKEGEEGLLILELTGDEANCSKSIKYLEQIGVKVQPLDKDIKRNEDTCTHCTACISHCPTQALYIKDRKTMEVDFNSSKCIACESCVLVCPVAAMKVKF